MTARIRAGDVGSDVNVRDHWTAPSRFAEAEGNHVGRATVAEMLAVERGHRAGTEEGDGHHGLARPLGIENASRNRRDSRASEGKADAVGRDVNRDAHAEANSDDTPPLRTG